MRGWLGCGVGLLTLGCAGLGARDEAPTVSTPPIPAPPVSAPASAPASLPPAPAGEVPSADPPAPGSPAAVVRATYARSASDEAHEPSWLPVATEDLAARYAAARVVADRGCGVTPMDEGDIVVDAQDILVTALTLTERVEGERATVTARFLNFDAPRLVTFRLLRQAGAWRIDDIEVRGERLRDLITASATPDPDCHPIVEEPQ